MHLPIRSDEMHHYTSCLPQNYIARGVPLVAPHLPMDHFLSHFAWYLIYGNRLPVPPVLPEFHTLVTLLARLAQVLPLVTITALYFLQKIAPQTAAVASKPLTNPMMQTLYLKVVASLTLANKTLDDASYTTKLWAQIANVTLVKLARAERNALAKLRWRLTLSEREWLLWLEFVLYMLTVLGLGDVRAMMEGTAPNTAPAYVSPVYVSPMVPPPHYPAILPVETPVPRSAPQLPPMVPPVPYFVVPVFRQQQPTPALPHAWVQVLQQYPLTPSTPPHARKRLAVHALPLWSRNTRRCG